MEQLSEKLFDFLRNIPKSYYLPIVLFLGGLIFFSIGLIQLLHSEKQATSQEISTKTSSSAISSTPLLTMQVDVEGAVVKPGVYKLPRDARVQDGLIAAGGLSSDADRAVVTKSLNLAAKLADGVKIYVPKVGEVQQNAVSSMNNAGESSVLGAQTGLININSASESQLDSLPGIGPVTAQKIISGRPYGAIEDLTAKKVVTNSVFAKIKDKITVY